MLPELSRETRAALTESTPKEASLANPIDLLGSANAATYERTLAARSSPTRTSTR